MELILLGLLPFLFLILAASLLVVSQIAGFYQFMRFSSRERRNNGIIAQFIRRMGLAQFQLAGRSRQLEELSRRLQVNNAELERLNTLKTKFLSMAVHDVRTPLGSVRGFSGLLGQSRQLGSTERKYLNNIVKASDQIGHLMDDLTDIALIEAGKFRVEMAPFSLSAFIAELVPSIGLLAGQKGVAFSVAELPPDVVVTADRFRLGRVLTNLLGNAVKFTPAGGRVELRVRWAGSGVVFSVKDTGPGIHPAERRRIFEKFYQSRYSKDKRTQSMGWGLGLSIAEEIARAHGGDIGVESPGLGRGATFWVRIPLRPARGAKLLSGAAGLAVALLLLLAPAATAQTLPLDEKGKFEAGLERKVETVLQRILGPNRSKVVVDATVDFTRTEKFEMLDGAKPGERKNKAYAWGEGEEPAAQTAAPTELLPGVALPASESAAVKPRSYERKNTFPTDFLKRLTVTVILDSSIDAAQSEAVRDITTQILDITPVRGDNLTVVHAAFTPLWKTVWQEPETAWLIVKYLLVSLLSVMTLAVVAICLLRLAGAMREMALAQTQQMSMDMTGGPAGGKDGLLGVDEAPADEAPKEEPLQLTGPEEIRFQVKPEQMDALTEMLSAEDAANVALIAAHLEGDVRAKLLESLPAALSDQVLASLGRVRYVEPEMIQNLKEELERRLSGAVGGLNHLVPMIDAVPLSKRAAMIETLAGVDPELGKQLRSRVFLFENLAYLAPEEWSLVNAKINAMDWAEALAEGPQNVADSLKAAMHEGAWRVLSQMIESKPGTAASRRAAQDKVAKTVMEMIAERRIQNIVGREPGRIQSGTPS